MLGKITGAKSVAIFFSYKIKPPLPLPPQRMLQKSYFHVLAYLPPTCDKYNRSHISSSGTVSRLCPSPIRPPSHIVQPLAHWPWDPMGTNGCNAKIATDGASAPVGGGTTLVIVGQTVSSTLTASACFARLASIEVVRHMPQTCRRYSAASGFLTLRHRSHPPLALKLPHKCPHLPPSPPSPQPS